MRCYYWEDVRNKNRWKICTPKILQNYVLWYLHDAPTAGLQRINRSCALAKLSRFYWMNMNQNGKEYIRCYDICEERKQTRRLKRHEMKSYIMSSRLERIVSDIASPF